MYRTARSHLRKQNSSNCSILLHLARHYTFIDTLYLGSTAAGTHKRLSSVAVSITHISEHLRIWPHNGSKRFIFCLICYLWVGCRYEEKYKFAVITCNKTEISAWISDVVFLQAYKQMVNLNVSYGRELQTALLRLVIREKLCSIEGNTAQKLFYSVHFMVDNSLL